MSVIVEADSPEDANRRAERIGLYFDGADDCRCCGSRWYAQWSGDEGTSAPQIYDTPVEEHVSRIRWLKAGRAMAFVHYADGHVQGFDYGTK